MKNLSVKKDPMRIHIFRAAGDDHTTRTRRMLALIRPFAGENSIWSYDMACDINASLPEDEVTRLAIEAMVMYEHGEYDEWEHLLQYV